jgi:hypothetical protein
MQSYYEINVSHNGVHLFATAQRSLTDHSRAMEVLKEIKRRFPETEGFNAKCTYWAVTGYDAE